MTKSLDEPSVGRKWRISVTLVVTGFPGTLLELSRQIGMPADRSLPAGEPVGPRAVRAADIWIIDAGSDKELSLQEQLRTLLERVSSVAPQLSRLPPPTSVTICCGILDYTRDVSLNFDADALSAMAQMNASLDVDYYDMSRIGADRPGQPSE